MTDTLEARATSLIAAIKEISDHVERYQAVKNLEVQLDADLKDVKAEIARNLHEGRSWQQVGDLLGVTGSRAEQISRASR
ncbi:hypothetical protein [Streptomyces parvus]|uniref:hypothetical protein n=1 Tax=Streptomyces TaxID=1883 RepID=UPI002100785B|nr:hypothetical protein [Streptomyces parvus]MCQ1575425.1 hypothetical protein [Streptomyces parvus]